MAKLYSFRIDFRNPPPDANSSLYWFKCVYVSGICIIAKNSKYGGFYRSRYVRRCIGKFHHRAGSHRYPVLAPRMHRVQIFVENFPKYPTLDTIWAQFDHAPYMKHIRIKDIQPHDSVQDLLGDGYYG